MRTSERSTASSPKSCLIARLGLVVVRQIQQTTTSNELPSVEEEKQLREMVQEHKRLNEIAEFFGESPESIKKKIGRLKLEVVVHAEKSGGLLLLLVWFCLRSYLVLQGA
jgi:hypothetical protein